MEGRCLAVLHCTSSLIDQHGEAKSGDRPEGGAMGADEEGPRLAACQRPRPGDRPITMFGEDFDDRIAEQATQSRSDALHLGPGGSDDEHRPSRPRAAERHVAASKPEGSGGARAYVLRTRSPAAALLARSSRTPGGSSPTGSPIAGSDRQAGRPGAAEKNRKRGDVVLRRPAERLEQCRVKHGLGTRDRSDLAQPLGRSLSQTDDEAADHPPAQRHPD